LWKTLRPLAVYDTNVLDEKAADTLSGQLSDRYFAEDGGLMLTAPVRNLYFALRDVSQKDGNGMPS
jgi:hypothetical protein